MEHQPGDKIPIGSLFEFSAPRAQSEMDGHRELRLGFSDHVRPIGTFEPVQLNLACSQKRGGLS